MRSSVEKGEVGVTVQLGVPAHPVPFCRTVVRPLQRCRVQESAYFTD
jgi:hypothetical protein